MLKLLAGAWGAVVVAAMCLVGLLAATAWALHAHLRRFGSQAAGEAAAAAGAAGEQAVEQSLKRITPYIVVQPGAEIMFARKESAAEQEASETAAAEEGISGGAAATAVGEKKMASYLNSTRLYMADVFAMPELE